MFAPFDTLEADAPRLKLEVIELAVHFVNELLVRVKLLLAVAVSPVKRFSLLLYAYTPTATTIPPPYVGDAGGSPIGAGAGRCGQGAAVVQCIAGDSVAAAQDVGAS